MHTDPFKVVEWLGKNKTLLKCRRLDSCENEVVEKRLYQVVESVDNVVGTPLEILKHYRGVILLEGLYLIEPNERCDRLAIWDGQGNVIYDYEEV